MPPTEITDPETRVRTARPGTGYKVRPLTLRLVLALALFPIVPSSSLVLTTVINEYWGSSVGWFDDLQFWMLFGTVAVTLVSLCIWRAYVVWTTGRYAGTVMAMAIPIAQVLWWQPLWQAGCGTEEVLKVHQSAGMIGLWVWGTVWIWWGWSRFGTSVIRGLAMSDSARRVLLSLGSIAFVFGGYVITMVFLDDQVLDEYSDLCYGQVLWSVATIVLLLTAWYFSRRQRPRLRIPGLLVVATFYCCLWLWPPFHRELESFQSSLVYSNLLWAPVAMLSWYLIWRATVLWNSTTRRRTSWLALGFLLVAVVSPLFPRYGASWPEVCRVMLPVMAWGGWMIATMLLWRFRAPALPERVEDCLRCSSCGYSLKGLYSTRCPECGVQPTLDELVATVVGAGDA